MKFKTDNSFDDLTSVQIKALSAQHWVTVEVCEKIYEWLSLYNVQNVLDIGSGVGKFCIVMSALLPTVRYTGVEVNSQLYRESIRLNSIIGSSNCELIHSDFSKMDFSLFDAFFFYNSFYQQLVNHGSTYLGQAFERENFKKLNHLLSQKLKDAWPASVLITYQGFPAEIVSTFKPIKSVFAEELILWRKI